MKNNKVAVLGAGNGGQAMAAHLAMKGFDVALWDRKKEKIDLLNEVDKFSLVGEVTGTAKVNLVTYDIAKTIKDASVIMVATTADAHKEIAALIAPYLEKDQVILLNPGRTFGALEVRNILTRLSAVKVFVAEAQSLIYACRVVTPGVIRIVGFKKNVPVASMPAVEINLILDRIKNLYDLFVAAKDILETGLENIGAVFHPAISVVNANKISAGEKFFFYHNLTLQVSNLIESLDAERISLGKSFGKDLISVNDWIERSYNDVVGNTLYERIVSNPAYISIEAPKILCSRLITEDIPTGLVPFSELGKVTGLEMKLTDSLIEICSVLCGSDFRKNGRNIENLGLTGMNPGQIIEFIT